MKAIEEKTGLNLAQNSDRIGNFLRFDRLSSWNIDRQTSLQDEGCWVRALHSGPRPQDDLVLNARFLAGNEIVAEETVSLPIGGVAIGLGHDYSTVSLGLFDAKTGRLLAREAGAVFGGAGQMRTGISTTAELVTDSSATAHSVSWIQWNGPGFSRIDQKAPWGQRSRLCALRTRRLQERADVRLFKRGERNAALGMIREVIQKSEDSKFLYIWDPYFDASVVLDFLGWLPPKTACRILCGKPPGPGSNRQAFEVAYNGLFTDLRNALTPLRQPPKSRQIDLRFRVSGAHRPIYHDRFIITQDAAWVLGASLNGIGNKEGSIVQLLDPDPLRWLFEDEWATVPSGCLEKSL
jgi:hypothetical protein